MSRRTRRWEGALAATVALAVVGLFDRNPALLLAGAVPLAYAAYGSLATVSVPDGLVVTRTVEPTPAPPGRTVSVRVTVENRSDRTLADCRIVDGVPDELAVVGGSPRAGVTLAPGESVDLEYEVVARRGDHRFDPPAVAVRGLGGGAVARADPEVDGDERVDCRLDAGAPPLEEQAEGFAGQLPTDRPGRGIEFHSVRRYSTGDAARRIDWRHYARRGELATVNYEQPGVATVVFVVDARVPSRVVPGPGRPSAVELGAYAGTRALSDLLGAGHDVGVAVVGGHGDGPAGLHWLAPGSGADQRTRAGEYFRRATDVGAVAEDQRGPAAGPAPAPGGVEPTATGPYGRPAANRQGAGQGQGASVGRANTNQPPGPNPPPANGPRQSADARRPEPGSNGAGGGYTQQPPRSEHGTGQQPPRSEPGPGQQSPMSEPGTGQHPPRRSRPGDQAQRPPDRRRAARDPQHRPGQPGDRPKHQQPRGEPPQNRAPRGAPERQGRRPDPRQPDGRQSSDGSGRTAQGGPAGQAAGRGGGRRPGGEEESGTQPAAGDEPSADGAAPQFRELLSLTGPGTQFVLLSPLLDDGAVSAVETWRAFGRSVIVLSPDVVPDNTVSGQFSVIQRRTRLADCQARGARTIDWRRGTPLPIVLEYAFAADARVGSPSTGGTGHSPSGGGH